MNVIHQFNQLVERGEAAFYEGKVDEFETATRLSAKIIRNLADAGYANAALQLEPLWYTRLVKVVENEARYHRCFAWHKHALWAAGRKHARALSGGRIRTRVAFLVPSGVLLGHTEVLLRVLANWKEAGMDIHPVLASLGGMQPGFAERLNAAGIPSVVASPNLDLVGRVAWLADVLAAQRVQTAVWVSYPCWVAYVFGVGVAPRQVMWSLKYHPVHMGETVTHIAMTSEGTGTVSINGEPWVAYSPPLGVISSAVDEREVEALRARWAGKVLVGTLARHEKFNSPDFIRAVIEILRVSPRAHYLYTGHLPSRPLVDALQTSGLSDRATFIGWVDTNLYARVLDVFLESFPFGCGVTGMQALSAGTPLVSLRAEDTLPKFYGEIADTAPSDLWRIVGSTDEYVMAGSQMISAAQHRGRRRDSRGIDLVEIDRRRSLRLLDILL